MILLTIYIGRDKTENPHLWDVGKIKKFIEEDIKTTSNRTQCFRIMKRLGIIFGDQKERIRDEATEWYKDNYPDILKKIRIKGGEILFIDKTRISMDLLRKNGVIIAADITPTTKNVATVIGAITIRNSVKFYAYPNAFSTAGLIKFITLLLEKRNSPLHLILKSYPECNKKTFKEYIRSVNRKITLHFF